MWCILRHNALLSKTDLKSNNQKLNYTSRLKTSEINFIALSLSSISFGSKVNDKPGIDLTSFDEYELLLEVNPDTS